MSENFKDIVSSNEAYVNKITSILLSNGGQKFLFFKYEADIVFRRLFIDAGVYNLRRHDFYVTPKNNDVKEILAEISKYVYSAEMEKPLRPLYVSLLEKYSDFIMPNSFFLFTALAINKNRMHFKLSFSNKSKFDKINEKHFIKYYRISYSRLTYMNDIYRIFNNGIPFSFHGKINCHDVALKMRDWFKHLLGYTRKATVIYGGCFSHNMPIHKSYKRIRRFIVKNDIPACEMLFDYLKNQYGGYKEAIEALKSFVRFYNGFYSDMVKTLIKTVSKQFNLPYENITLSEYFSYKLKLNNVEINYTDVELKNFISIVNYKYDDESFIYKLCLMLYSVPLDGYSDTFYPYNINQDIEDILKRVNLSE